MNTYIFIIILLGTIATLTVINAMHHPSKKTILKNKIYACLFIAGICILVLKEGVIF